MEKSKGTLEAEISKALTQWEKDYLGRGSVAVKTDILRDMIIVSLKGVLTPAEYNLCQTKDGMLSIKKLRTDLIETGVDELKKLISAIIQADIKSFHTDISTQSGERIMVFKLSNTFKSAD